MNGTQIIVSLSFSKAIDVPPHPTLPLSIKYPTGKPFSLNNGYSPKYLYSFVIIMFLIIVSFLVLLISLKSGF